MRDAVVPIEKMAAGGDAIAHLPDGKVVFVSGALPGETVEIDVVTSKRDFARAVVRRVVEASPMRVTPSCPEVARGCGGCDWQHVSAAGQQQWKLDIVVDALRRTARMPDAAVRWGGSVPAWGYRTSMRAAGAADGTPGLRAASSNEVVPLDRCAVLDPALDQLRRATRCAPGDEVSLRVSSSGRATARFHGAPGSVPSGTATGDDAAVVETVHGVPLRVSAGSFFQSGPAAAELLVSTVRTMIDALPGSAVQDHLLVDAYGGVGLFSATLGWDPCIVVEGSESACVDAAANLGDRAVVVCGAFEEWDAASVRGRVGVAVVDPARTGMGRRAVEVLVAAAPETVVLVSCDPVAMARDVALLGEGGYVHVESVVLDLFPQTHHVEVVTLFERRGSVTSEA
ncbi:MAG: class I SAM-dependent RNA methyltransferase [Ilumatobacteraceae bacterium]